MTTELNADLINRLRPAIWATWEQIAADAADAFLINTNEGAVELCIDANRLALNGDDPEADALVTAAVRRHGYLPVLHFLSARIDLINY